MSLTAASLAPAPGLALPDLALALADLTGLRDRERLLHRLAETLSQSLRPRSARLCRRSAPGEAGPDWQQHPLAPIDAVAPAWPEEGPQGCPVRQQALRVEQPLVLQGAPCRAFYPLATDRGTDAVLELLLDAPPPAEHRFVADQVLRAYRNLVGLLDYSERDSLTGLLNRKTFDETFMRLASPALPGCDALRGEDGRRHWHSEDPCWLAVLDIDHFKQVNDRYGHLVGDEVLLLVAQLMGQALRHRDRLYRFGGEEFVVLMRCADAAGAEVALQRLRQRIAAHTFPQVGHLTISIGFTRVDADDTPEAAFGRADQAVYAAKQGGRDQVRNHAHLQPAAGAEAGPAPGGIEFF